MSSKLKEITTAARAAQTEAVAKARAEAHAKQKAAVEEHKASVQQKINQELADMNELKAVAAKGVSHHRAWSGSGNTDCGIAAAFFKRSLQFIDKPAKVEFEQTEPYSYVKTNADWFLDGRTSRWMEWESTVNEPTRCSIWQVWDSK